MTFDTKSDAEKKVKAMEFIAPIIGAQMKFDQAITNRLMSDAWGAAEHWATLFRDLVYAVEKANDSVRVMHVLDAYYQPDVNRRIEHYRSMSGIESKEEA